MKEQLLLISKLNLQFLKFQIFRDYSSYLNIKKDVFCKHDQGKRKRQFFEYQKHKP